MGWAHTSQPSAGQAARNDLAHELDVALHGQRTFDGPATERRWLGLLDEVRTLARPASTKVDRARQARADGAAMRAGS